MVGEDEPELDHPEQQEHEQRDAERELDERLAAGPGAPAAPGREGQATDAHRTGSIRIEFDLSIV